MRKGNLVQLNPAVCFTTRNGGQRKYCLTNGLNDNRQIVDGYRHITADEVQAWNESPESKGMNSAGESKLPPVCVQVSVHKDDVMTVERARCREAFWYGNPTGGWAKLRKQGSDEVFFVKRDLLRLIVQ